MNQRRKAGKQSVIRGASACNSQPDADEDDLTNHPCNFCGANTKKPSGSRDTRAPPSSIDSFIRSPLEYEVAPR